MLTEQQVLNDDQQQRQIRYCDHPRVYVCPSVGKIAHKYVAEHRPNLVGTGKG